MGKRELLLVAVFIAVGVVVYQVTAPPGATANRTQAVLDEMADYFRKEEASNVEGVHSWLHRGELSHRVRTGRQLERHAGARGGRVEPLRHHGARLLEGVERLQI